MILFPAWFFEAVVYGGIVLAAIGSVLLLVLLLRDIGGQKTW
jgi:hypothetical protein